MKQSAFLHNGQMRLCMALLGMLIFEVGFSKF